jgi:ABC-type phosphate/phosphonate transport system ATPase subunit
MTKIVIRNLTKTYSGGNVVALQDINFEIEPYESVCILGRAVAARRRCCESSTA